MKYAIKQHTWGLKPLLWVWCKSSKVLDLCTLKGFREGCEFHTSQRLHMKDRCTVSCFYFSKKELKACMEIEFFFSTSREKLVNGIFSTRIQAFPNFFWRHCFLMFQCNFYGWGICIIGDIQLYETFLFKLLFFI